MFAAVGVVLGYFTLSIGNYLKIGFSSLPNQCVFALFGPAVGMVFGGLLDVLKYFIRPTGPYFPGFTLNAMIAGLIYGTSYYRKPLSFTRILITELIVSLVCNILLNTLWLTILYGEITRVLLIQRVIKNLIQVPITAGIFYLIGKNILRSGMIRNAHIE